MIRYIKPPLGILPRRLYDQFIHEDIHWNGGMSRQKIHEERLKNLGGAITRYAEANLPVDFEWVIEYNQLLSILSSPTDMGRDNSVTYNLIDYLADIHLLN